MKYVQQEKTRHGATVYYFRRGSNSKRIRLMGVPGSQEFETRYRLLMATPVGELNAISKSMPKHIETIEKLLRSRVCRARDRDKKRRGITSTITPEWAIEEIRRQKHRCAMTGLPFKLMAHNADRMQPFAPSLDRIDVSKGYEVGNVRIVILAINVMRLDWGTKVFDLVIDSYRSSRTKHPSAG